jgi:hypothetical protein
MGAASKHEQWKHVQQKKRRRNLNDGCEGRGVRAGEAEAVFAKAEAHSKGLQIISQAMQRNPKSQEVRPLSVSILR